MYPKLEHPFSMIIAGPSGCGKSTFVCNLLHNLDVVNTKFHKILWCNSETNAIPKTIQNIKNVRFLDSIPDEFNNPENKPILVILDDFMTELDANAGLKICELFTKGSHHRSISVILITQNIFHKGRYCRDISLNAKYIVIFKNPRDKTQFNHLARQIYPENVRALKNLYKEITQVGHSYLFIDLSQGIHDAVRFRTNIFNRSYTTCYCDKTQLKKINLNEAVKGEQAYVICAKSSRS
jgi:ABC-type dipeptide/oligopeptide/nickel transport system ATPase subunit